MNGLYGKTHFELEEFIDLTRFDQIQLDIWKGIAIAKPLVRNGYLIHNRAFDLADMSYELDFVPLMLAYEEYVKLPDTDPIKITGEEINNKHGYNALATFIKYAFGAHDLYSHFSFWDYYPGWRSDTNQRQLNEAVEYFPSLIDWINGLVDQDVFSNIGRAYLIALDANGYSFEHKDPPLDPDVDSNIFPEFIHVRFNTDRPFYVYDSVLKEKHYIKTRVGWWNDRDIHGGDVINKPSYAVRIDGIFSNNFKRKIGIVE
jgi:hypothetical protein